MATKAGSQKDLHIIGSDDNPMKCALNLQPVMDNLQTFLSKVGYPDSTGSFNKSVILAGDFYVWMYATKLLKSPRYSALQSHILPVPDLMHVALNSQEAVLVHAWTIIHPLWVAGYPEVENTSPINMRPKRRTAMLALAMTAWQECRQEILKSYNLRAAGNSQATPVRKAMLDSIISVFEELIPLSVDCPYLLSSGDIDQIKMCLNRLFPLFAFLGKKNYVNIILFQLGLLEKLPSHLPKDVAMALLFSTFSSEDLEVFHSVLRAAIRFQDTNEQVSRKALLITAMRVSPIDDEAATSRTAQSPLEKAAEDVVPRMVAYLRDLFSTLFLFSFDIIGQTAKMPYASALPHYSLVIKPLSPLQPTPLSSFPSSPSSSSNKENPGVVAPSSDKETPGVVVATIRESLVPLPLRRQPFINLGNHIDIQNYQSVPMPLSKIPLADSTNGNGKSPSKAKKVRDFLKVDSLKEDLAPCGCIVANCQCKAMYQWIANKSLTHFSANIDKNPVRDLEGK
ncbi:hypothetical protein DFS34DRAFT_608475 [Phlyctochytrium arcticum]|nr:hypothetical protein DFS34DRAFT_608475 [Phlyctochytrium arcticum]